MHREENDSGKYLNARGILSRQGISSEVFNAQQFARLATLLAQEQASRGQTIEGKSTGLLGIEYDVSITQSKPPDDEAHMRGTAITILLQQLRGTDYASQAEALAARSNITTSSEVQQGGSQDDELPPKRKIRIKRIAGFSPQRFKQDILGLTRRVRNIR